MKKQVLRILAMLLCLTMVIGIFAGCKKEETKTTDAPETTADAPAGTDETTGGADVEVQRLPLVAEGEDNVITIGLKKATTVEDYDTNAFTLWLEETTGVDIEFVYFASDNSEAATQLALMVSGGEELPDIIWDLGLDQTVMNEYGEDGYFIDLTDYFADPDLAYHFNEVMDFIREEIGEGVADNILSYAVNPTDGAIYAFPEYQESGVDKCATIVQINQEWLDAVGMEAPTTVEELYDVLVAFRDNDPNGNGKQDELPIWGGVDRYRGNILQWIINAYVYCNDRYFFNAEDGQLWEPYTTDEYREALIFINKLIDEGLLSEQSFSMADDSEMKAILTPEDGVAIAGIAGAHPTLSYTQDNELVYEYTALAPLQSATDIGGWSPFMDASYFYQTAITEDCENPKLAFKLLSFLCSEEAMVRMRYGEQGVDWDYAEEGYTSVNSGSPIYWVTYTNVYGAQNNQTWNNMGSTMMTTVSKGVSSADALVPDDVITWTEQRSSISWGCRRLIDANKHPDEVVFKIIYTADENEEISEISTNLQSYVKEARALFATGVLDPNSDADWQTYLDNLEAQGLSTYIEVSQDAYDRMNG